MFLSHGMTFPSGSVTIVSSNHITSGKNFLINQSCQKFRHT